MAWWAQLLMVIVLGGVGCRQRSELVVFHAASLSRVLGDFGADFERRDGTRVLRQPSG